MWRTPHTFIIWRQLYKFMWRHFGLLVISKQAYWFYYRVGVIFAKKTKARKTRQVPRLQYEFSYEVQ